MLAGKWENETWWWEAACKVWREGNESSVRLISKLLKMNLAANLMDRVLNQDFKANLKFIIVRKQQQSRLTSGDYFLNDVDSVYFDNDIVNYFHYNMLSLITPIIQSCSAYEPLITHPLYSSLINKLILLQASMRKK